MVIVNVQQIKKYHAANLVLDGATLQLQEGEKVGLIGRNGSGKSTMLRLIAGHDQVDDGMLTVKRDLLIGYLPQIPAEFEALTVYEVMAYGFRDLMACKQEMSMLEHEMAGEAAVKDSGIMERLLETYARVQEKFEQGGGYDMDTAIDQVASGLSIDRSYDQRSFGTLSGGEKTRIVLASQLVVRPALLLLDEPTNHLDLKGIEWLEQFIQHYEGACVIVSHDRYFLDTVGTKMIELEDGEAHTYHCNYSGYLKEKEERLLQQFAQFQEQQKVIRKMKETIRQLEEWGRIGGNGKFFKRAASIRKALERMETVKRPVLERNTAEFELTPLDRSGRNVISFEGLTKQFGERMILQEAEGGLLYGEKVVLLGDNGSGKTTLFKLLLGEMEADSGQVAQGTRLEIGYLAQQEPLKGNKQTVLEHFRLEGGLEEGEARNVLAKFLFYGADVFKPLAALSGGEWSRLRLALLVRRKPNLLLLDEPTNHLDVASREALEEALEDFPGTVLAISHDRYFINRLAKRVWELDKGKIATYLGNYDDFKEKREERLAQANTTAKGTAGTVKGGGMEKRRSNVSPAAAGAPANKRETQHASAASKPSAARHKGKLEHVEQEIAKLEAEIAIADAELERIDSRGETENLEKQWREREELQTRLDQCLEQWLELSS
ncbi:ATPase components of ABC transporters with duplicated ATPase domains [Paenibacillus algorifonticola]|uniref:ATPase components of ABC transporters with duplicated ATPase domains n=1 Tax=Paenibacillus algorifonticola TaxID=684063 RepID=A0A1I1XYW3_9BACL|nr:ABC-F family ATP-binding cassette domain-containing protein [Paenibacillus algorifonticola]SFE12615.1 ATPase components of ABC transporters with duplicated ATPase domains [Paenibacillus algorifonticola]